MGAQLLARLDSPRGRRRFTADVQGAGWVRLADRVSDPVAMDAWVAAERDGTARGHLDLAGSLVAYRTAAALAELTIIPLLAEGRALVLNPAGLWLSFDNGARVQAVGLTNPMAAVTADDAVAGRDGTVVVADDTRLHAVIADGLAEIFSGLVAAVRARAPFGTTGMWGILADHVADVALGWARTTGHDPDRAWATVDAVIDALRGHPVPRVRARPRRQEVSCAAGCGVFVTRGTCCLIYKSGKPAPGRPDAPDEATEAGELVATGACGSCPLRSDEDRHGRFVQRLTEQLTSDQR